MVLLRTLDEWTQEGFERESKTGEMDAEAVHEENPEIENPRFQKPNKMSTYRGRSRWRPK